MQLLRTDSMPYIAGAFYVRTQAMAVKHSIPLEREFDEKDGPGTRYIVALDGVLPVATCRLYPIGEDTMLIGRVVVLPEYRRRGLGTRVVLEAEAWARDLGMGRCVVDGRDNKLDFYTSLGYKVEGELRHEGTFATVRMGKTL